MGKKLERVIETGKRLFLIGSTAVLIGCASSQIANNGVVGQQETKGAELPAGSAAEKRPAMNPVYFAGKPLDAYFKEFNAMDPREQEAMAKGLNKLSLWDTILLSRYVPLDGMIGKLSEFYGTDCKGYLQTLLAESGLDPLTIGLGGDKGLGQLTSVSEKWARDLYKNEKKGYKFPGAEIVDSFDPFTNLVLSSILFRTASEEKVADIDAVFSLYNNGFTGVTKNREGLYVSSDASSFVPRAKSFEDIAGKMMTFSWLSMNRSDLAGNVEDPNLRKVIEANNEGYDGRTAYEGMIDYLSAISPSAKYSADNRKMLGDEVAKVSNWLKVLSNRK